MSGEIDNRIVSINFDNAQFEKNVGHTLESLGKLEKGMNLEKSAKSMDALSKAGQTFSLSRMAQNIEDVSNRFTTMGIIGMTALQNITNGAINAGKALLKSLTIDPISSGWQKYEQETAAVQTIMSATGKTIDNVSASLEKLSWFTDETSYNFVDMVGNIGKFTSSGVDLDVAVTSMQGIANWAAISGQNAASASRAMYNLAQSIGMGSVKLQDWKSIENANMATVEFKNTVIETAKEMGVLNKTTGKTAKGVLVTAENFSSTLQHGWFKSDVLTTALEKYGDFATKVFEMTEEKGITASEAIALLSEEAESLGYRAFAAAQEAKTFTDVIDSVKDAVSSGWMGTWRTVFGNYEEAKGMWTKLANELYDIFAESGNARNEMLAAWADAGGRDDLFEGLFDALEGLKNIGVAVSDVFNNIFPPITVDTLLNMSKAVKEFGKNLKDITKYYNRMTGGFHDIEETIEKINRKTFGKKLQKGTKDSKDEIKQLQEDLIAAGYALDKFGADGIFGEETKKALEKFQEAQGIISDGVYGEETHEKLQDALGLTNKTETVIKRVADRMNFFGEDMKKFQRIVAGVFSVVHIGTRIFKFLGNVIGIVWKALKPVRDMLFSIAAAVGDALVGFDEWLGSSNIFETWAENIENALVPITEWLEIAADKILYFLGIGEDRFEENGVKVKRFGEHWSEFKEQVKPVTDWMKNAGNKVKQFLGFTDGLDENGKEILTLAKWWTNLKAKIKETGAFDKVVAAIDKMKEAWRKLWPVLKEAYENVKTYLGEKFGAIFENFGGENGALANAIEGISTFIIGLISWFTTLFESLAGDEDFKNRITNIGKTIVDFAIKVWEFIKSIGQAISSFFKKDETGIESDVVDRLEPFKKVGRVLKDIFGPLIDWLVSVVEVLGPGGIFGILGALIGFAVVAKVINSIKGLFKLTGDIVEGLATLRHGREKPAKIGTTLLQIAAAIGIIVGTVYLLGTLDEKQIKQGILAFGIIIGGVIGMFAAMNMVDSKFASGAGAEKIAAALLSMGASLALIAVAIFVVSKIDSKKALTSAGILVGVMSALLLIAALTNKLGGVGTIQVGGMIGLSIAIAILAGVAWLLGKTNWGRMLKGITFVALIMGVFIAFAFAFNAAGSATGNMKLSGFLKLAVAIGILAGIAWILGKVDGKAFLAGLGRMILVMGALLIFSGLMSAMSGGATIKIGGLVGLAVAVGILAGVVMLLGAIQPKAAFQGILSLVGIMGVLTLLFNVMSRTISIKTIAKAMIAIIAISALMGSFALVLNMISKDIGADKISAFSTGLLQISIGLSILMGALTLVGLAGPAIYVGLLGMIAVIGVIVLLVAALGALFRLPGFKKFMNGAMADIGEAIGNFTGAMKAAEMRHMASALSAFDGLHVDMEGMAQAIEAMKMFSEFSNEVTKTSIWKRWGDNLFGSELMHLAIEMEQFGVGFAALQNGVSAIDLKENFGEKTRVAIASAQQVNQFGQSLPKPSFWGNLHTWLSGGSSLSNFAADLKLFGEAIGVWIKAIELTPDDVDLKTDRVIKAAAAVNKFASGEGEGSLQAPHKGWAILTEWIGIESPLFKFSVDLAKFAVGMKLFMSMLQIVPDDSGIKTDKVVAAAKAINKFGSGEGEDALEQPNKFVSMLSQWVNLESPLWTFSKDLAKFAVGIQALIIAINLVQDDFDANFEKVLNAAKKLNNFDTELQAPVAYTDTTLAQWTGGTPGSGIGSLSAGILAFGGAMQSLNTAIAGLDETADLKTDKLIEIATALNAFFGGVTNEEGTGMPEPAFDSNIETGSVISQYKSGIDVLTEDILAFGEAMQAYLNATALVVLKNNLTKKQSDKMLEIAKDFAEFASGKGVTLADGTTLESFGTYEGPQRSWIGEFLKGKAGIAALSEDVTKFSEAISPFIEALSTVPADVNMKEKTDNVLGAAKALIDFAKGAANVQEGVEAPPPSVWESINEWSPALNQLSLILGVFGESVKALSEGMSAYKDAEVEDVVPKVVDALLKFGPVLQRLQDIGERMPDKVVKETPMEKALGAINGLLTPMNAIVSLVSAINVDTFTDSFDSIEQVMNSMLSFVTLINNSADGNNEINVGDGWSSNVVTFLNDMSSLSTIMSQMAREFSDTDTETINGIITTLTDFMAQVMAIPEGESSTIANLKSEIEAIYKIFSGEGETPIDSSAFLNGLDPEAVATKISEAATTISTATSAAATTLSSNTESLNTAGSGISDALVVGASSGVDGMRTIGQDMMSALAASLGDDTSATTSMTTVVTSALSIAKSYVPQFSTAGYNMSSGVASGIRNGTSLAIAAAIQMASAALQAAKNKLKIQSPSKAFAEEVGLMGAKGTAIGFENGTSIVASASSQMGEAAIESAKGTLTNFSDLFSLDLNTDPVIRPVVDLSAIHKGAKEAQGLLNVPGNMGMAGTTSRMLATSIGPIKSASQTNQNGKTSEAPPPSVVESGGVVVSGNTFHIRDDNDIALLAQELGQFTHRGQRALGAGVTP